MSSSDDTPIFPSIFLCKTIEEIASNRPGAIKIGPFGSQLKKEDLSEQGYKVYGQENIIANDFSIGTRRVDTYKFSSLKSCLLYPGDLVLTMMGTIGKCAIVPANAELGIMDSHLLRIQVDSEIADIRFVALIIESGEIVGRQIDRLSHGSIMSGLSSAIVRRLQIPLPSISEQHPIADILDTIDTQIQETERLITKLKQQKVGLMHDLLTRGIDENGELRDPVTHPEQFIRNLALGRIPKEWEIITLGNAISQGNGIIQTGPFGSQLHAYEYVKEGIPVIMPQDIQDGYISEQNIARISPYKALALARHRVEPNDVVFARRGDLSRCIAINTKEVGWLCGTGCLLVRPPRGEINGAWLANMYQHHLSQQQIAVKAVGSTMVNLNTTLLAGLIIAKPSHAEQCTIVTRLNIHESRIRTEKAHLDKLKQIKKGLMHDLLTGRVRVPLEPQEADQVSIAPLEEK